jgi:hypothetical protein
VLETPDEIDRRIRHERLFGARLRLATPRLEEARRERIRAIVEAHQAGLSVRQLAAATGPSSSRVHQLLGWDEARENPRWLGRQRGRKHADRPRQEPAHAAPGPEVQAVLGGELEAHRRGREWLGRLDRGETVMVDLRPETDPETEYESFDRPRVHRVLARILADLDALAGDPPLTEEEAARGDPFGSPAQRASSGAATFRADCQ